LPLAVIFEVGGRREWRAFLEGVRSGRQPWGNGNAGKEANGIPPMAEKSLREKPIANFMDLPAQMIAG